MSRYSRQELLGQIGPQGQHRLRSARVLLVGVGALGATIADQLVRAGVGTLRLADRDIVEPSNLQRQTLFDEADARDGLPKAEAAARRLRAVNPEARIEPLSIDVAADNIESLCDGVDLILDGTDNATTRYLINDVAVKRSRPWVYGACVGVEGRSAVFDPARGGPCLRCVFPNPPDPGELETCDTVGVLGPVAGVVSSLQVSAALRMLIEGSHAGKILVIDGWSWRFRAIDLVDARRDDCLCCARNRLEFLSAPVQTGAVLCGRGAVQIRPARPGRLDLTALGERLARTGIRPRVTPGFLRVELPVALDRIGLTVFSDGRAIVQGTDDLVRAKSIYDKYIGM